MNKLSYLRPVKLFSRFFLPFASIHFPYNILFQFKDERDFKFFQIQI